ncbi:EamA family transporter RarD [Deferribacter autotrophicus]|uniref:EamA family transporter RarD n=1 Tax=Deferribacter autotrophicus TaxID=500465 RepID=A0A5A8F925_9BACT|nr:EamA family transporter RarD [Deferribacter autotrophicus]KAA0259382.1 EamA family transporter RarD [Deferribacter autotrophicus]
MTERTKGFLASISAFIIWGILPFYWKKLIEIPALEILAYRISMTFILLAIYVTFKQGKKITYLFDKKIILTSAYSALFLALNWLIYVWGVNSNKIIECSLGYYITPLVSVLFGRIFFKEDFTKLQIISILFATVSVLLLTIKYGKFPYVAVSLAITFSFYSVFRKKSSVKSVNGLFLETAILTPVSIAYIVMYGHNLFHLKTTITSLLIFSGFVTATPLLMYVYGIRTLRLSTVGMLQYIGPTLMFIIGLFVYKETFTTTHLISFLFIWIAIAIFIFEPNKKR